MNIGAIGRQVDDDRESTQHDDRGRVGLTREPPDRQSSFMTCRQHSGGAEGEEDGGHFALVIVRIITRTSSLEMMMTMQTKKAAFLLLLCIGHVPKNQNRCACVYVCLCMFVCMYVCECEPS